MKIEISTPKELKKYARYFSENDLKTKISRFAQKAGIKVVYGVLLLNYVVVSKDVPATEKAIILGALGYFILPFDLVPDLIPLGGYADDFTVLLYTLDRVHNQITPEMKAQAKKKLHDWFGDFDEDELNAID